MVALADSLTDVLEPKTADGLNSLGMSTVGELLRYVPRRYLRRGQLSEEQALQEGEWITVVGRITKAAMIPMKKRKGQFLKVAVSDGNHTYDASFFNAKYIKHVLKPGTRVMLAGTVKFYRGQPQLSHPQWVVLSELDAEVEKVIGSQMLSEMYAVESDVAGEGSRPGAQHRAAQFDRPIIPMYPANRDIQSWDIWAAIQEVLGQIGPLEESLPDAERSRRGLVTVDDAVRSVHLPETDDITAARERLKFDEALAIQLVLAQRRLAGRGESAPACPHVAGGLEDALLARLPFTLTDGQQAVIGEIGEALRRGEPMSRLLQGEVGSGKTLVSLLAMLR